MGVTHPFFTRTLLYNMSNLRFIFLSFCLFLLLCCCFVHLVLCLGVLHLLHGVIIKEQGLFRVFWGCISGLKVLKVFCCFCTFWIISDINLCETGFNLKYCPSHPFFTRTLLYNMSNLRFIFYSFCPFLVFCCCFAHLVTCSRVLHL
jgi:hypothetical protein